MISTEPVFGLASRLLITNNKLPGIRTASGLDNSRQAIAWISQSNFKRVASRSSKASDGVCLLVTFIMRLLIRGL